MKDLKDDDGVQCTSGNDKLRALVDRNFFTKNQEPLEMRVEGGGGYNPEELEDAGYSLEELEEKIRIALRETSNKSRGYRFGGHRKGRCYQM